MVKDNKHGVHASVKPEEEDLDLHNFKLLPYYEQLDCLLENGTYLGTRYFEAYKINTYHLPAFFAEVWYDNKSNEVAGIRAFTSRE
jgi:hypothetical protein